MKSASMRKNIIFLLISFALMFAIAFLPEESSLMPRSAWKFMGIFVGMLVMIISRALPEWSAGLISCCFLVLLGITDFAGAFSGASTTSCWMIGSL